MSHPPLERAQRGITSEITDWKNRDGIRRRGLLRQRRLLGQRIASSLMQFLAGKEGQAVADLVALILALGERGRLVV